MIATELIDEQILPLQVTDTGHAALIVMNDQYLKHIPVLDKDQFVAMLSEEDLLNNSLDQTLQETLAPDFRSVVSRNEHLYLVMSKMAELKLTVLPVIDAQKKYLGAISQEVLLQKYSTKYSFSDPGSILVLEMQGIDYSLANIARVIEAEQAHILSSTISRNPIDNQITLTIKIDKLEIRNIVATLERMEYTVLSSYQEQEYVDDLQERYDALMHYLNM